MKYGDDDGDNWDNGYGVGAELYGLLQFSADPRWRSPAVIDLCRQYRIDRDVNTLAKLADALQDSWCEHKELLAALYATTKSAYGLRLVALIESDELAEKVKWLEWFAKSWNFFWKEMIEEPEAKHGELTSRGTDLYGSGDLGEGSGAMFWDCVEAITGKTFDEAHREEFGWSCSC